MTDPQKIDAPERDYLLSHKTYERLKVFVQLIIPATITFVSTVGVIWGIQDIAVGIGATLGALGILLGVIIKIGDVTYNASESKFDGRFWVDHTDTGTTVTPQFKQDLPELAKQGTVTLKVEEVPKT